MMKELYTAPEMELIRFTPAERLANDTVDNLFPQVSAASPNADYEFDYEYKFPI